MKRIYTALSIAALVLAAGSCEKNLDIPQKSVLSTEDFYTNATAEDAEALIGSVYHLYWGGRDVTCVNGIEKILFLNLSGRRLLLGCHEPVPGGRQLQRHLRRLRPEDCL